MLLFLYPVLTASLTDSPLTLAGYTNETAWHAPRGRSLPSLTIAYTSALTAGTVSVQVQKNGVNIGNPAVLSTAQHLDTIAPLGSIAPGDHLTILVTTSADFLPISLALIAVIP